MLHISLAVDPRLYRAYSANWNDNTVSVINTQTDTVVGTIIVGSAPTGIAVNPRTDRGYVTNHTDNTVSVLDLLPVSTGPAAQPAGPVLTRANFMLGSKGSGIVLSSDHVVSDGV